MKKESIGCIGVLFMMLGIFLGGLYAELFEAGINPPEYMGYFSLGLLIIGLIIAFYSILKGTIDKKLNDYPKAGGEQKKGLIESKKQVRNGLYIISIIILTILIILPSDVVTLPIEILEIIFGVLMYLIFSQLFEYLIKKRQKSHDPRDIRVAKIIFLIGIIVITAVIPLLFYLIGSYTLPDKKIIYSYIVPTALFVLIFMFIGLGEEILEKRAKTQEKREIKSDLNFRDKLGKISERIRPARNENIREIEEEK